MPKAQQTSEHRYQRPDCNSRTAAYGAGHYLPKDDKIRDQFLHPG